MPSIRTACITLVSLYSLVSAFRPDEVQGQISFIRDASGGVSRDLTDQAILNGEVEPLAISISGAISVGSYQAGVNWALLEVFRRASADAAFRADYHVPKYALTAITGASAGNINTLLWAIEACTERRGDDGRYRLTPPDSSLFSQVWTRMDITDMLRPTPANAPPEYALLNLATVRQRTDGPVLQRLADPRLVHGCEIPVGITLTRVRPGTLRLQKKLEIETQRFATIFEPSVRSADPLTGQRMQFHPVFDSDTAYTDPRFGKLVQLSPFPGRITVPRVLSAVQASSAYPLAFRPVELAVRYPDTGRDSIDLFVDGGVFDNNPLSLALNLYRVERNLQADTGRVSVIYVNPDKFRAPISRTLKRVDRPVPLGGMGAVMAMLDGAVSTARQYELQLIAREQDADEVRRALVGLSNERAELATRTSELAQHVRQLVRDNQAKDVRLREVYEQLDSLRVGLDSLATREAAKAEQLAGTPQQILFEKTDSASQIRLPSMLPSFTLRMTTRSFPLYSSRLNAFAGFLGRPFREFDFWVGAYDALHIVARELTCGEAGTRQNDCVADTMAALIRDTDFFQEPGRSVLAAIYDTEFRDGEQVLRKTIHADQYSRRQLSTDTLASQQRAVLLALFRAIEGDALRGDPVPCYSETAVGGLLCNSGLTPALAAFRDDTVTTVVGDGRMTAFDIVERWSKAPACGAAGEAVECHAQPAFVELVKEPEHQLATITDQLLIRLNDVERSLQDRSDGSSFDWSKVSTTMRWAYQFGNLAHPPHSQVITSGIPDDEEAWYRYLPYHIGGMIGAGGVDLRYRPTKYVVGWHAITFPVLAYWLPSSEGDSGMDLFLGGGVGYARRTKFPLILAVSEWGIETHVLGGKDFDGRHESFSVEIEPYVTGLAGALRIGYRRMLYDFQSRGHIPMGLTIGVNDLGALIHWLTRR